MVAGAEIYTNSACYQLTAPLIVQGRALPELAIGRVKPFD